MRGICHHLRAVSQSCLALWIEHVIPKPISGCTVHCVIIVALQSCMISELVRSLIISGINQREERNRFLSALKTGESKVADFFAFSSLKSSVTVDNDWLNCPCYAFVEYTSDVVSKQDCNSCTQR